MFCQSSRDVLTFTLSTCVQVGNIAPSPLSAAFGDGKSVIARDHRRRPGNAPSSLCVKISPPYLSKSRIRRETVQSIPTSLTCWLLEGCRASTDLRSPPDFPPDQIGKASCAAQTYPAGQTDVRICKLIDIDRHPTATRSGVIMQHNASGKPMETHQSAPLA